ncbi:hypothetical protein D8674_034445 [Pyrus ussuriensis x Pyrus communis]|uniref:Uncharacterized protein n=1 Tax=Pyrus ussuriensis x Pyrus communis TaxID=2448454 RepID=A0A5N5HW00_9ROSA|nr:hypothetical protein D8674_034445 [Pyrus ussuriensis x Pyrus communis]
MLLTHGSTYIKNALQRRFVDFRHKLKKHFDSFLTLEEAKQNKHEDVTSQEEWKFLCDRYASVQFKEAKTGEQLSAIVYFEVVHKNTKNGWVEEAKLKWEEMLSMKNETTLLDGTMTLTDDEIVPGVLGHKSGYFKGPSKFVSCEDTMLDKQLEEKLETQQ